jgi:hypothetical protein
MNKLTITEKVFVPVSVNEKDFPLEEVCCINDSNMLVGRINYMGDGVIRPIVYCEDELQEMGNVTHWLKEETNKYVLSEEELKDLLSKVFRAGNRRGYSGYPNTDNWTQPTEEEFINSIL